MAHPPNAHKTPLQDPVKRSSGGSASSGLAMIGGGSRVPIGPAIHTARSLALSVSGGSGRRVGAGMKQRLCDWISIWEANVGNAG
jgi:hypothetical protein